VPAARTEYAYAPRFPVGIPAVLVQPIIASRSFRGSVDPRRVTTALVFFQSTLLAGYAMPI